MYWNIYDVFWFLKLWYSVLDLLGFCGVYVYQGPPSIISPVMACRLFKSQSEPTPPYWFIWPLGSVGYKHFVGNLVAILSRTTAMADVATRIECLHDDVIKWKHFPRYWAFVREIHRSTLNSPHKGHWRGALTFSLIFGWINRWVNHRQAGDLRRHCAHHDANVM